MNCFRYAYDIAVVGGGPAGIAAAVTAARAGKKVALFEQNSYLSGALAIGLYFKAVEQPFGIPYGSLVSAEVDNLMFAGRCVSCDAVALGSLRVIPSCLGMGQAAGVGAGLCVERGVDPAQAPTEQIRKILLRQDAILSME